jgi:hypothetical protein
MLMTDGSISIGPAIINEHERSLYKAVQRQIKEIIQDYLRQTIQTYPIQIVFDMSDIQI